LKIAVSPVQIWVLAFSSHYFPAAKNLPGFGMAQLETAKYCGAMQSQLQGFFVGEKIRQLLHCDAAFTEHCERLNYKADPSRDPKLVSATMGRALLEIALCFGELAEPGTSNKGLYGAASTITELICDHDPKEPEVAGGCSLALKRLLGSRGGMAVAQTITRVLAKVDQLAPWDEESTIDAWRSFLRHYCQILWRESSTPIEVEKCDTAINTLLEMLLGPAQPAPSPQSPSQRHA
jgi:hypothetical protein